MSKVASSNNNERLLIEEPNEFDVLLGRGNNVNHRKGNRLFRKLAAEKSSEYTVSTKKEHKDSIAQQLIDEITDLGGRFLRPITAANAKGEVSAVWEVVTGEVVSTKAKQAMRDAAAAARKPNKEANQQAFAGITGIDSLQHDPRAANISGPNIAENLQGLAAAQFPLAGDPMADFQSRYAQSGLVQLVERQRMLDMLSMQAAVGAPNIGNMGVGLPLAGQNASLAMRFPGNQVLRGTTHGLTHPGLLYPQLLQPNFHDHRIAGQIQQQPSYGGQLGSDGAAQHLLATGSEFQPVDYRHSNATTASQKRPRSSEEDLNQQDARKRRTSIALGAAQPERDSPEDRKMPSSGIVGSDNDSSESSATLASLLSRR